MSGDPSRSAFVAGATGYTGRAVVETLRARGVAVTAHVRPGSPRLETLGDSFRDVGASVDTTPWDRHALASRLTELRPDVVFALLGITRAGAAREKKRTGVEPSYETIDYGLTVLLLDAISDAGLSPRFVYLSSLGTSATASGEYLRWRWKAEERVRKSGLPFTIARPSFITGDERDEDRPGERIGAAVASVVLGASAALGAKRFAKRYGSRTNTQLASALVDAALDPAKANRTLESEELG
ncbi:MAG: NAD(P)H-binding protein [Myxococcales bacterium]|nr:NAD(P)H-binding protein [Myxococcales bacterium]MCB9532258.1 NAD(P)H-binding protein [Myxococcales bacterium]MCB9533922.1 NAD(P)H-binding protein [Myxococcales bacterium]